MISRMARVIPAFPAFQTDLEMRGSETGKYIPDKSDGGGGGARTDQPFGRTKGICHQIQGSFRIFYTERERGRERQRERGAGESDRAGRAGGYSTDKRDAERRDAEKRTKGRPRDADSRGRDRRLGRMIRDAQRTHRSRSRRAKSGDNRRRRTHLPRTRRSRSRKSRRRRSGRMDHSRNSRKRSEGAESSDTRPKPASGNKSDHSQAMELPKDLMWELAFLSSSRSDFTWTTRTFRGNGYRTISAIMDMGVRER